MGARKWPRGTTGRVVRGLRPNSVEPAVLLPPRAGNLAIVLRRVGSRPRVRDPHPSSSHAGSRNEGERRPRERSVSRGERKEKKERTRCKNFRGLTPLLEAAGRGPRGPVCRRGRSSHDVLVT